jgi:hypothetical protein
MCLLILQVNLMYEDQFRILKELSWFYQDSLPNNVSRCCRYCSRQPDFHHGSCATEVDNSVDILWPIIAVTVGFKLEVIKRGRVLLLFSSTTHECPPQCDAMPLRYTSSWCQGQSTSTLRGCDWDCVSLSLTSQHQKRVTHTAWNTSVKRAVTPFWKPVHVGLVITSDHDTMCAAK